MNKDKFLDELKWKLVCEEGRLKQSQEIIECIKEWICKYEDKGDQK